MDLSPVEKNRFIKLTLVSMTLVLTARYVSFIGLLALFGSVAPQMLMFYRGRRKEAALSWAAVALMSGAVIGPVFAVNYISVFILYAIVYSILLREADGTGRIILNAASVWCLAIFSWVAVNRIFFGMDPVENISRASQMFWSINISRYYDYGISVSQILEIEKMMSSMMQFFSQSIVGLSVITGLTGSWIVYHIVKRYSSVPVLPGLTKFRMPEYFIWGLIAVILLYVTGSGRSGLLLSFASNAGVVILAGYALSGLGLAIGMMGSWNFSLFTKTVAVLFIILFLRGVFFFLILGIIDVWADFRKRLSH